MSRSAGVTLAVGASGKFAGLVVPALVERGARVRGMVRRTEEADAVRSHGAAETVVGDLTDAADVERALEGVTSVFYVAPAFMPNDAEIGRRMVESAQRAGVERFVFSSVIHPVLSALPNHAGKAPVEEALLNSGLGYTILHPALFFQNYPASWKKVVETGTLAEPWSCDTRFSRVDYRDVAEVAAIALTEDRLLYGTFELCADGWLDRHDVASLIGRSLGREIRAARVDPDTLGDEAKPMQPMFRHYDKMGLRSNPLTLRAILGREPRTRSEFFSELAADEGDH